MFILRKKVSKLVFVTIRMNSFEQNFFWWEIWDNSFVIVKFGGQVEMKDVLWYSREVS